MPERLTQGYTVYGALILILLAAVALAWWLLTPAPEVPPPAPAPIDIEEPLPAPVVSTHIIGSSVAGRPIAATIFNPHNLATSTAPQLLFVGGIHGGYEWNSVLLAYEMIDYLTANPTIIPDGLTVAIIPDLNPDGTHLVTGTEGRFTLADIPDPATRVAEGRFNQNGVDLNRNFDCKWAPESTWRNAVVSAGSAPFSEPEAAALRDFVLAHNPVGAVFWHSQANNVYGSECEEGILPGTLTLMSTYARAANYGEVPVFDAYPITGDAEGWLASIGIPAVTVELQGFSTTEWPRNLAGVQAVLELY